MNWRIMNGDSTIYLSPCSEHELIHFEDINVIGCSDTRKIYKCWRCHQLFDGDSIDAEIRSYRKNMDW